MKRYINKNNILEIIISIVVIIGIILICVEYESPVYSTINKTKELKKTDFAMYKNDGDNNYYISNDNEFPSSEYTLNTDKTYCKDINENKIKNIVNMVNGKAQVTSDKTVYCYLYFDINITDTEWVFDYTGSEQTFTAPYTGNYIIETWGAQGGSYNDEYQGGYGGYSTGEITLTKNQKLYINVGGAGTLAFNATVNGGYNGGGKATVTSTNVESGDRAGTGGGATHIAKTSGLLSTLSNKIADILLVSGSGGGVYYYKYGNHITISHPGNGGGINGGNPINDTCVWSLGTPREYFTGNNATQTTGGTSFSCSVSNVEGTNTNAVFGSFGKGGYYSGSWHSGGGAGFYGGGSGYIGNANLTNKHMTCYECQTSNDEHTKTISNTCVSANPVSDCSKTGHGYAKITFIG